MEKSLFIFNFKRIPWAFLSSVFLFSIIQAALVHTNTFWRFCYFYSTPSGCDSIRLEAQLRTIPPYDPHIKIFLIGSSQTREDFNVEFLNEYFKEMNMVFYNLGISGYGSPMEMFALKDKFLSKSPDVMIYVTFVGSFYPDDQISLSNTLKYYFTPEVVPYVVKHIGIASLMTKDVRAIMIDYFLGEISVLFKYRDQLRQIFFTPVISYLGTEKWTKPMKYAYSKNQHPTYFAAEIIRNKGDRYKISPYTALNEELFSLFTRDVVTKKVKLIVISGPTHPLIKETYKAEMDGLFNHFLLQQASETGFLYLAQKQLPSFDQREFIDFTHLNALGRGKFSLFIRNFLMYLNQKNDIKFYPKGN